MQEMRVWSLIQEDPLEEGIATHSSILVWGIQWTEEPVGLQSMGSQRVEHNLATKQQWGQNGKGLLKGLCWEFPGWPVVKTPGFHSRGQGLNPDWETKIPHATWHGQKKKRKKKAYIKCLLCTRYCAKHSAFAYSWGGGDWYKVMNRKQRLYFQSL